MSLKHLSFIKAQALKSSYGVSFLSFLAMKAVVLALAPFGQKGLGVIVRTVRKVPVLRRHLTEISISADSKFVYPTWDDYWPRWLLSGEMYEPSILQVLDRISGIQFGLIDAGANFGYWSVVASDPCFGSHSVVAIEASPETFEVLKRNSHINGERFAVLNRAVSDHGNLVLKFAQGGNHVASRVVSDGDTLLSGESIVSIASISLEQIAKQYLAEEKSLLIKLDVEGAELAAFNGAGRVSNGDVVFIYEDHGMDRDSKVTASLLSQGYDVIYPHDGGSAKYITNVHDLIPIKIDERTGYNFIALRGSGPLSDAVRAMTYPVAAGVG